MVSEADFVKTLGLTRVLNLDVKQLNIEVSNTNRPGMQFANYWDFFPYERPQLLGKVEMTYLSQLDELTRRERLAKYFNYPVPASSSAAAIPASTRCWCWPWPARCPSTPPKRRPPSSSWS